ncbi:MAG: septum formation initiator family protein [Syntrophomonadaceae bacterium]|nr:septum formation initiator family protein [Syntrophomonadaceae bacterium]
MTRSKKMGRESSNEIKTRRKKRRVIVLLALLVVGIMFGPRLRSIWDLKQDISVLENQKAALLKRNAELTQMEKKLQSQEMIEKLAREELGMIKPEEKVIIKVIPEQEPDKAY